jgi:hypothetical protein
MWQDWTNGVLGLALVGVAFLGLSGSTLLTGSTLMWALAGGGAIVAIVGFWGAGESTTNTTHLLVKHA